MLLGLHEAKLRPPRGALKDEAWIHAVGPTDEERSTLVRELGVPAELLAHALDADEIARVTRAGSGEERDRAELVVLRIPVPSEKTPTEAHPTKPPWTVVPLGIIFLWATGDGHRGRASPERVVSLSLAPVQVTEVILGGRGVPERAQPDGEMEATTPVRTVLRLVLSATHTYLTILRDLEDRMDALEERLSRSTQNREVLGLLAIQKTLIKLESALRSNQVMLNRLERDPRTLSGAAGGADRERQDDAELRADVAAELEQALEMTTLRANELTSMMDAFASLISNNLNAVMKFLTSLAIVLTVPVLIASLYGMNVPLPYQSDPRAFTVIIAMSVGLSLALVLVFRRLRWL